MKNKSLSLFQFPGKWKTILGLLFILVFLPAINGLGQAPFPYTFINNSDYPDDQLYVCIFGEALSGGQRIWIDLKTGQQNPMATSYNTMTGPVYNGNKGPGGNAKYADIFTKLSDMPGKAINLSGIQGARVYISIQSPLYFYFFGPTSGYAAPNPGDPNDPSRGIRFETIELTYNSIGIWENTSRVDAFELPMALEVNGSSGFQMTGELLSDSEISAAFLANVPVEFQGCYDPATGEIKQATKTAAFQPGAPYENYMKPYIDAVWNKYKSEDLVVDCGGAGVWRGRVQGDDRLIMNCSGGAWNGRQGIVQRRPNTQEAFEGKGVLAQPIADGGADLFFQGQLCAAFTRHVINSTTPNVGTQIWSDASKYYLQSPCNHYAKFWHLPGISVNRLSYGFAYDDVNNQSSTLFAAAPTKSIVVIGGYVPKVAITAPTSGSTYGAPASITFQATASAATPNRSISKIEFYNGTTKIGEDNSSPFSFTWTNVAGGTYTITAKAIDNNGVIGTSAPITVKVNASIPPTISITAPANNTIYFTPANVTINANATQGSSPITKVEFYNGATKLGEDLTSPYSFDWTSVPVGIYSITAKAIDNNSLSTTSAAISIEVKAGVPPTVSITAPVNGTSYIAPAAITINASAIQGTYAISKLEFYSGTTKLGEDLSSPYTFDWANVPVGSYSITAKAIDFNNLSTTSSAISVEVKGIPPVVSITAPLSNTSYFAPATITINAATTQGTFPISKVEFYNGTTKLGEDLTSPYSFDWTGVAAGTYSITAKAIDNTNLSSISSVIIVIVNPGVSPTVTITAPLNNTSYFAPAFITINADATQGTFPVSKVEFYNGTTKLGEDLTSPYSFDWTNVAAGTYSITAKAIDNTNLSSISSVITVIVNPGVPPAVTIAAPLNNTSYFAPASITIDATATQGTYPVSKVEFYNGTTKLGEDLTSPYSFDWTSVATGTYSITAKAIDNTNLSSVSSVTTVIVNPGVPPTVTITAPLNNASYFAPAFITINADATQGTFPVSKVEFYNGATKLGEDLTSPYSFDWTNVAAGTYSITAKAIDINNLSSVSSVITVDVKTIQLPGVTISAPLNNSIYIAPATVTIQADVVQGSFPVSKVEFYNGTTKLGEDLTSPYSFTWSAIGVGNYSITAKAIDNTNLSTVSSAVTIIVNANQAPVVSITSPATNSSYKSPASIQLQATASDADGTIASVEFYNGTSLVGTDNTAPYTLDLSNLVAGVYVFTAKATDNLGLSTSSALVTVTIKDNVLPLIFITAPVSNSNYISPATVALQADATDSDGSVTKVEFYNGSVKLGEDATSPYTFDWSNVNPGTYAITAKAYDDNLGISTSTSITIFVKAPNQAPLVTLTSPLNGSTSVAPSNIQLTATVSDSDGFISKVEFYNGATKLGEDLNSPYEFNWTNVAAGTYTITVKAYDNENLASTSSAVSIIVNVNQLPQIQITSPTNNVVLKSPADFTIQATASDVDGVITKVEFYNGSALLATDYNSPYSFSAANVAAGTYTVIAKAYDDKGGFYTSSITIKVVNGNSAPQLYVVSPSKSATINNTSAVDIYAIATDADGSILKVEFYDGSIKLGEVTHAPYSFEWANGTPGLHELVVIATDNEGKTTQVKVPVTISKITSVIGSYLPKELVVYPNPTYGEIRFTKEVEYIEIYDMNGTKVHEENVKGMNEGNITQLSSGVYIVRLMNGSASEIVKITKQ